MSKLKSRIFGGKTPSSQDSQEEKGGLTVHLYHDVDTPAADQLQHFPERDTPYIAEEICVEVAKKLNISELFFDEICAKTLQACISNKLLKSVKARSKIVKFRSFLSFSRFWCFSFVCLGNCGSSELFSTQS